jgi:hypothetical protein
MDLREVSGVVGRELVWRRRLAGGEQGGADLVCDSTGHLLVLKRQPDPLRAARVISAVPVVQHATGHGWRAARWLCAGRLSDGAAVVLQEHVTGQPVTELDVTTMAAVLAANDSQAGLAHPDAFDDSAQLTAVARSHPWRSAVAHRSTRGAVLVRHGDAVMATVGRPELPTDDVVHGDYSSSNFLVTEQGIAFVDCETVGRGTRVRDLADLYRQCFIYPGTPAAAVDLLRDHAIRLAGARVFTACVVAVTYNNLAWWAENKSETDFDVACGRAEQLLEACADLSR